MLKIALPVCSLVPLIIPDIGRQNSTEPAEVCAVATSGCAANAAVNRQASVVRVQLRVGNRMITLLGHGGRRVIRSSYQRSFRHPSCAGKSNLGAHP